MNNIHGFKSLISLMIFSFFISFIILFNKVIIILTLLFGKSSFIEIINKVLNLHLIALYINEIISPVHVSLLVNKIF